MSSSPSSAPGRGGVSFTDVQATARLFAEAILGRPVRVELLDEGERGWPYLLGLPAADVVRVPAVIDSFATVEANRLAYRAQVLHQCAFTLFGTFTYCDNDNPRPTDHPRIGAATDPILVGQLVVLLEHARVRAATDRRFPGSVGTAHMLQSLALADFDRSGRPTSRVVDQVVRFVIAPEPSGSATDVGELCAAVKVANASFDTSIDVALRLADLMAATGRVDSTSAPQAPNGEAFPDRDAEGYDAERTLELDESEHWFSMAADADDVESVETSRPIGQRAEVGPIRFGGDGQTPELIAAKRKATGRWWPAPVVPAGARTFFYDEWDYIGGHYLPAHCRIVEQQLSGSDTGFLLDVIGRHADLRTQIRRQFAMLRPRDRQRAYRRDDGDELDIDAIIESVADRRSGAPRDDRFHIRRDLIGRDVATAFLVDLSASTSSLAVAPTIDPDSLVDSGYIEYPAGFVEQQPEAGEPDRRVIDIAKDAVALMCDALHQLGDQYAVYGFSGTGRDNTEFHVATEFDDRSDPASFASIAAMEPRSYTRMGPAIRHTAAKLARQSAKTKLLIMISDGYPQDIDYGPNRSDKVYGLSDTAKALREAAERGIDTFAVTIDPAGHDYLRTMCPDNQYLVIDEVASLPMELAKLYLSLAGGVEWRTRFAP